MKPMKVRSKGVWNKAMQNDGTAECAEAIKKWLIEYDIHEWGTTGALRLIHRDRVGWEPIYVGFEEWLVADNFCETISVYSDDEFGWLWEIIE